MLRRLERRRRQRQAREEAQARQQIACGAMGQIGANFAHDGALMRRIVVAEQRRRLRGNPLRINRKELWRDPLPLAGRVREGVGALDPTGAKNRATGRWSGL